MSEPLTDDDLMPFGKYGPGKGDHRKMQNVPASYLLWLRDQGCSDPRVKAYIEENLAILLDEHRDHVESTKD